MYPELLCAIAHSTGILRAFNQITQHAYFTSASDIRFCNIYILPASCSDRARARTYVRTYGRTRTWLKNKSVSFRHDFLQNFRDDPRASPRRTIRIFYVCFVRPSIFIEIFVTSPARARKKIMRRIEGRKFRTRVEVTCTLSIGST